MINRIVTLIFALIVWSSPIALAGDDQPISFEQLPEKAQSFIQSHFAELKISHALVDKDLAQKEYSVIFTNGDKVEFNKKGLWTEIYTSTQTVYPAVLPQEIFTYLEGRHADVAIQSAEYHPREKVRYEVKLANGIELNFKSNGEFISYDD